VVTELLHVAALVRELAALVVHAAASVEVVSALGKHVKIGLDAV
jgi:hypothetical protein